MRALGVLITILFAAQAHAQEQPHFRVGIGAGQATIEADDFDLEGRSTAWEGFVGYEVNKYLAIELGYIDGGSAEDTILGATVRADTSAIVGSVVGTLPIGDTFSLYGRVGYMKWDAAESATLDGVTIATADVDGNDPIFGAGVAALVEGSLIRIEYRAADLDDTNLSLISLSIAWRF